MLRYVWANKKGGVGKTTGCINHAGGLAQKDFKVLVIDMASQANVTSVLLKERQPEPSVFDFLIDEDDEVSVEDVIYKTEVEGVDIIPSHKDKMNGAERELANVVGHQNLLSAKLHSIPEGQYDYILIDTSNDLGILTVNSLSFADKVIVPVRPGKFALDGIADLFSILKLIRSRLNPKVGIAGFVLNEVERTNVARDVESTLRNQFGERVLNTCVPKNIKLEEAHSRFATIFQYAPTSAGAQAYLQLTEELLNHE